MAARLEHQRAADPVETREEILPLLAHRRAGEDRTAAGDEAHRIAAGMPVDALEGVHRVITPPRAAG